MLFSIILFLVLLGASYYSYLLLLDRRRSYRYAPYKLLTNGDKDKKRIKAQSSPFYPKLHIAPSFGLINDPNGLSFFNGWYYIFYQHHPNSPTHGLKNWSLVKTQDFIRFESQDIFLAPQFSFDNFGMYSGGATILSDKLFLFYTGNQIKIASGWFGQIKHYLGLNLSQEESVKKPTQCKVVLNKRDEVIERKVIIDYDGSLYTEHVRDPFPFQVEGKNYLLLGSQKADDLKGHIVLYHFDENYDNFSSLSFIQWDKINLEGVYMCECPAFFQTEKEDVLIFSPQGLKIPNSKGNKNIYDVVYMTSFKGDILDGKWEGSSYQLMDKGFDFYAPQIFNDGKRTILIGWLGQVDDNYPLDDRYEWSQMLTLPREISVGEGILYQRPIQELKNLRKEGKLLTFSQEISLPLEIEATFTGDFELILKSASDYFISFSLKEGFLTLDRSSMEYPSHKSHGTKRVQEYKEPMGSFSIYIDTSAIEIFMNKGDLVFSSRFFITHISTLQAKGSLEGFFYPLNSICKVDIT